MKEEQATSEFCGVDVSGWSIVPLRSQQLNYQLKSRYLPERGHLISQALQNEFAVPTLKNMRKTVKKNDKKLRLAVHTKTAKPFKIMSPEAIVIKCAKRAYERILEQKRKQIPADIKKDVAPYFQRKKANQRKRRQERRILIKAFKWQLLEIFGTIVFTRRWPIGREELLSALDLLPSQVNYDYLTNFIQERKKVRTIRDRVSDHRLVRFIYNNPFRTLQRKNIVEYSLKIQNEKKFDRSRKDGRRTKAKKKNNMRKDKLFCCLKQRASQKSLDRLAESTISEQFLIKEEELEESETEAEQTDSVEPAKTLSSS